MEDLKLMKFGPACGKHGSCVFYKGFKYIKNGKSKIITLGQFFFMKILDSIPVSIGELQLVWEDKNSGNDLVSVRLYFLPECTPDGRQPKHGEDEVLAYYEKIVVKLSDLAAMLVQNVSWSDGRHAFTADHKHHAEDSELDDLAEAFKMNSFGLDNRDVEKEKDFLDKKDIIKDSSPDVIILTYPKYCRYRCMMKRLEKCEDKWVRHALVCALGGFNARIDNNRVYFCRDVFEHGDLDDLELRCDHLAPNLKGRPRKRKGSRREDVDSSDESSCESSYSSLPDTASNKVRTGSRVTPLRNGLRIDKAKVSKDEQEFLIDLHKYMKSRNSPIGRIPSLGFKQIDLFQFYQYAEDLGGYDQISNKRMWKHLYDKLGGNPGFTSAATCTRRHYEKLLLPYERYKMGQDTGPLPHKKKKISRVDDDYSLLEKVKMSRQTSNENKSNDRIKTEEKSEKKQITNGKSETHHHHHKDKVDDIKDRALIIKQEIEKMKMRKDAANQGRLLLNKTNTKSKVIGTNEKKKCFDESRKLRWAEKGRRPSGAQKTVRELLHRNGQETSENSDGGDKIMDKKYIGASVKEEMRNLEKREEKTLKDVKVPSLSQALPASVSQVDSKSLSSQTLLPTLSQGHPMFYPQLIPVGGALRGLPPVGMPFMIPHNFNFQPMHGAMPQIPGISSAPVVKDEKPLYALNKLVSEHSAGSSVNKSAIVPQSTKHVSSSIITPPSAHCSLTSSKGSLGSSAGSQGQRPITPAHSHNSKRQYPYSDRNHSSYDSRDNSVEPINPHDLKRQKTQTSQEKKYESGGNEYDMPVLDLSMKTLRAQEARHQRGESLLFNTSFNKENNKGHVKEEITEAPQDLSMKSKTTSDNKDGVPNYHKSVPLNIPYPHLPLAHNSTGIKDEPIKREMNFSTPDSVKSLLPSSSTITAIGGLPIDIGSFVHSAFPQHMLMPGIFPTPLHLRQMIQGQVAAGLPMVRPELLPSQFMFPPTISAVPPSMFTSVLPTVAKSSSNTASAIKR